MADEAIDNTVLHQLAAMTMDERIRWFLEHPPAGLDPSIDPLWVARNSARFVDTIMKRDEEQPRARRAS